MLKNLHPSTQILARNLEQLKGAVLLVSPVEVATVQTLLSRISRTQLTISCQDYGLYLQVKKESLPALFETHHVTRSKFDTTVVFLPKSDAEIEMTLAWASETLKAKGQLVLIGQNNAGIKSAKKTLAQFIGPVTFSDAARHSAFYVAQKSIKLKPFNLDDYWQRYQISPSLVIPVSTSESASAGRPESMNLSTGSQTARVHKAGLVASGMTGKMGLKVYSLPGTFSHGRLDEGTALLLNTLDTSTDAKRVLDWGCGAGGIGAVFARLNPHTIVDMVDSNALAVASAVKTITENKLNNAKVFTSNVFSDIANTYDYIVANPPFHKGHDTYYADAERFILETKNHLTEHGTLRIVANIFLRYEKLLEENFGYVKTVAKTNKYKILETVMNPLAQAVKKKKYRRPKHLNIDEQEHFENL